MGSAEAWCHLGEFDSEDVDLEVAACRRGGGYHRGHCVGHAERGWDATGNYSLTQDPGVQICGCVLGWGYLIWALEDGRYFHRWDEKEKPSFC